MTYIKIQWAIVLSLAASLIIWVSFCSATFYYDFDKLTFLLGSFFLFFSLYLFFYKSSFETLKWMLLSLCWMIAYNRIGLTLSYLANTTNKPLITSSLAAMDSYLGFYAPTLVGWCSNHPWISFILFFIYFSLFYQTLLTLCYLSFPGKTVYLESYMMQFMIAGVLTIIISAFFPAVGTYEWYGFATIHGQLGDLERLYELRQNIVDLREINGIIEFPSFHTIAAILVTYAFRHQRKFIFIPVLILNILVLFSCLSHGGHFFVDIIGGIAVAAIAIGLEGIIYRYVQSFSSKKTRRGEVGAPQVPEAVGVCKISL